MSSEELSRIFEPFFRAEDARAEGVPGVGLGLAVSRRIAETIGGTLEARSHPGEGSVFTLRLPIAPTAAQEPSPK